jgi:hypothetical protein
VRLLDSNKGLVSAQKILRTQESIALVQQALMHGWWFSGLLLLQWSFRNDWDSPGIQAKG